MCMSYNIYMYSQDLWGLRMRQAYSYLRNVVHNKSFWNTLVVNTIRAYDTRIHVFVVFLDVKNVMQDCIWQIVLAYPNTKWLLYLYEHMYIPQNIICFI